MLRNFSESLNNRETRGRRNLTFSADGVKISSYSIQDGVLNVEFK